MKTTKLLLFLFLLNYAANAQDKIVPQTKDTIEQNKISSIAEEKQVQPSKVIICGPSRAVLLQFLYIVDGKIIDNVKFNKINPKDIESLEVLKPEKAKLIYGDQGKNGAIIIIRKK